jgi:hypothetical protein
MNQTIEMVEISATITLFTIIVMQSDIGAAMIGNHRYENLSVSFTVKYTLIRNHNFELTKADLSVIN